MESLPENCNEVRALLPLFVGEDLEPQEMVAVQAHLVSCGSCEQYFHRASDARAALVQDCRQRSESQPFNPVTDDLWSGLRTNLQDEGLIATSAGNLTGATPVAGPASAPAALRPIRRLWVGTLSAAAAVLFAMFLTQGMRSDVAPLGTTPSGASDAVVANETVSSQPSVIGTASPASGLPGAATNALASNALSVRPVGIRRLAPNQPRRTQRSLSPDPALARTTISPDANFRLRPATAEDVHLIDSARIYHF
ncbi:MAG: hypothetical protein ACI841_004997, partial [Planctomycetota bacterium]